MKAMKQSTKRLLAMFLAFLMVFTMIPTTSFAAEGSAQAEASESPSAYGYDETDAESVTVNVTLSNDGFPIVAQDGTALSHHEVTVPYFDLANYDLQDYYRYGTANGSGSYAGTEVIKRPTLLHLYIYLIERYYMDVPEDECGTGTSGIFEYASRGGLTIGKVHYEGNKNKFDRKTGKIVHFSDEYSVLFVKDGKPVRRDYFTIRLYGESAGMVSRRA